VRLLEDCLEDEFHRCVIPCRFDSGPRHQEAYLKTSGVKAMTNCEKCSFRARYDRNHKSILGRLWKWHIGWCPGWKFYLKSVPEEKRKALAEQYG